MCRQPKKRTSFPLHKNTLSFSDGRKTCPPLLSIFHFGLFGHFPPILAILPFFCFSSGRRVNLFCWRPNQPKPKCFPLSINLPRFPSSSFNLLGPLHLLPSPPPSIHSVHQCVKRAKFRNGTNGGGKRNMWGGFILGWGQNDDGFWGFLLWMAPTPNQSNPKLPISPNGIFRLSTELKAAGMRKEALATAFPLPTSRCVAPDKICVSGRADEDSSLKKDEEEMKRRDRKGGG